MGAGRRTLRVRPAMTAIERYLARVGLLTTLPAASKSPPFLRRHSGPSPARRSRRRHPPRGAEGAAAEGLGGPGVGQPQGRGRPPRCSGRSQQAATQVVRSSCTGVMSVHPVRIIVKSGYSSSTPRLAVAGGWASGWASHLHAGRSAAPRLARRARCGPPGSPMLGRPGGALGEHGTMTPIPGARGGCDPSDSVRHSGR